MDALFLCLANSYKYGGRCLAGVLLEEHASGYHIVRHPDGSPCWIRPVMPEGTGEIPTDIAYGINLFDVVEIRDVVFHPHYSHSEDAIFSTLHKVRVYPRTAKVLELLCDKVHALLLGSAEKKITPEQYQAGTMSLALISPEHVRIVCSEVDEYVKFRVFFTYHGLEYNCSLTDPDYLHLLQSYGIGSIERNKGEMFLVISLGKEYQGHHHKLVAGVFDMIPDILQSAQLIPAERKVKTPQQALKEYFGYDAFRPLQQDIIDHIMSDKDCLVLMPTGGGKSICFQVPALLREGLTIVVSPLISLMKDQVETLRSNGIAAVALNSSKDRTEDYAIRKQLLAGQIKLLYVSPERLLTEVQGMFQYIKVGLIAIDEAHCISHWGHDFRPEYSQLGQLRDIFPDVPVAAFTATADKVTRQDIIDQLRLRDPRIFISSFDRPNLSLDVRCGLSADDKLKVLLSLIDRHREEAGIIYCLARRTTEELVQKLRTKGVSAAAYHAYLPDSERNRVQDDFLNDRVKVVCATIAFGMGIDKSNVRFVAHYNLPKNIESFYQEIGRGGRDGLPCETILFYNVSDVSQLQKFCEGSELRDIMLSKLERMREYAESKVCRRRILLNYFNESMDHDCSNCDVCQHPPVRFDGTQIVQKALSAIARTGEQIGFNMAIQILRGHNTFAIRQRGYHLIKTYGAGREFSFRSWRNYLVQMFQLGYYEVDYKEDNHLKLTAQGNEVLRLGKTAMLVESVSEDFTVKGRKKQQAEEAAREREKRLKEKEESMSFLYQLQAYRQKTAEELQKAPHTLFSDRTLLEIADRQPVTIREMREIIGVSKSKLLKYGLPLVSMVREHRGLTVELDGVWNAFPNEILPNSFHITSHGIRYDFDPDLFAVFPWSETFKRLNSLRYWNLWSETRVPLSDFVPYDNIRRDAVIERFAEIAQKSLGLKVEKEEVVIPLRIEYDADGNPVHTLPCKDFDDGLQQFVAYLEKEHHFPYRCTSAYECSLLRWYHEVSRGIISITSSQLQALDQVNVKYHDLPRYSKKVTE